MYATQTQSHPWIRPAWTPATIAMMVLGFMIFWPLGLAMIAYIIWGERLDGFKRDANEKTDQVFSAFKTNTSSYGSNMSRTGNVAFDDWREAELERLNEERKKLDEMRADFDGHMRELRRARDEEEFNRFMDERHKAAKKTKKKSVPDVSDDTA